MTLRSPLFKIFVHGLLSLWVGSGLLFTYAAEPSLPTGLGGNGPTEDAASDARDGENAGAANPELPAGLGGAATSTNTDDSPSEPPSRDKGWEARLPFSLSGFAELRYGQRTQNDPKQEQETVPEGRLQVSADGRLGASGYRLTADFLYNDAVPTHAVDLRRGTGWVDLREAWVDFRPTSFLDIRAGRMIATWGTGDLLFLNDLFPKDWRSFLLGRDVEYLKAPTQGIRAQAYSDWVNLDLLINPVFAPDRFLDGRQVSFFDPAIGRMRGRQAPLRSDITERAEFHARLHRMFGSKEVAFYFYDGFWKSPRGRNAGGVATFPELRVWGASVRGNLWGGIGHAELSYYDSLEDRDGSDPLINNSQMRYLIGYERELMTDFTAGVQAYLEQKLQFNAYRRSLPAGFPEDDEYRTVLTLRLTRLLLMQNLELSSFLFYSPSDQDGYWRPSVSYKMDDQWTISAGAGLFRGERETTFYGQFENNSNAWVSLRFSY